MLIDGDTGNTTIDGRLDTTDASFSEISTTGTAEFNGLSTFNNGLTVTSGSVTLPNSSIPSSAIIGGVGSNDFSEAVTMSDTLTVGGDASFNSNVYVAGDLSWNPASSIAANSIPASAIIGGVGSDNFTNAVTMSNTLSVTGNTTMDNSLNVAGTATAGELKVTPTIGGTGVYNYNASGSVGSFYDYTTQDSNGNTISALNAFISDDKTILMAIKGDPTATVTIHVYKKENSAWVEKASVDTSSQMSNPRNATQHARIC